MLDSLVEKSTRQLKKITKKETKLNQKNQNKMGAIKDTQEKRDGLIKELNETNRKNESTCEELEQIDSQLEVYGEKYEQIVYEQQGDNKVGNIKTQIIDLKAQISSMNVREGVIRAQVEKEMQKN